MVRHQSITQIDPKRKMYEIFVGRTTRPPSFSEKRAKSSPTYIIEKA